MSAAKVKLTPYQRARVKELMVDEGESRASAVAWVLAFDTEPLQEEATAFAACPVCGACARRSHNHLKAVAS